MKILKWTGIVFLVAILTAISQVGGIVYLLSRLTYPRINKQIPGNWRQFVLKFGVFAGLYVFTTFCIIPFAAKPFGRVPLPVFTKNNVKPLTAVTCLLNRHYVTPVLRQATLEVAGKMKAKYPGTTVCYMDACFPFFNRFPLFPHLSHNNGKNWILLSAIRMQNRESCLSFNQKCRHINRRLIDVQNCLPAQMAASNVLQQ